MRFLFAVKSCEYDRQRGAHDLIRATWGRDIDVRFFLGGGRAMAADEELVLAPDDYPGLPWKTREIARWAVREHYDFVFLCDTGSFVIPQHLATCGFEWYDYSGYWCMRPGSFPYTARSKNPDCPTVEIPVCYPWASGGGYILSRKALEIVASSTPMVWAEDMFVGQALAARGVLLHDMAPEGYKEYVVDWIHDEDNTGSLHSRSIWMQAKYEEAKFRCLNEGCAEWKRNLIERFVLRDDFLGTRAEHERILRQRQEQRARLREQN
jgi:hypothetical protein